MYVCMYIGNIDGIFGGEKPTIETVGYHDYLINNVAYFHYWDITTMWTKNRDFVGNNQLGSWVYHGYKFDNLV